MGADHGNTGATEEPFGICLVGDVNRDGLVNADDRFIINTFWLTGQAGDYTREDCDVNCNGVVDVADRSIVNAILQGLLCTDHVTATCNLCTVESGPVQFLPSCEHQSQSDSNGAGYSQLPPLQQVGGTR